MRLSLNKFSLTCRVTSYHILYDECSEHCLLSKIQTDSGIFTSYADIFSHVGAYLELCLTLACSKPCHIQNLGIFRTQDIFRTLSRHILAYSEHCNAHILSTLPYLELCIFRILAYVRPEGYSDACLFRNIQVISDTFNNDSCNNINFHLFSNILFSKI